MKYTVRAFLFGVMMGFLPVIAATAQPAEAPFFEAANHFLQTYVSDGRVDYQAIEKNPQELQRLMQLIGEAELEEVKPARRKAFLINAYNLVTINSIIQNGIPASPMDVSGFFDEQKHAVAGHQWTLDHLEKQALFGAFPDPRMHLALVCAAKGCPPLMPMAYRPATLDRQLRRAARNAVNNADFIRVRAPEKSVELSQIFEWYKADFLSKAQNLLAFVNRFRTEDIPGDYSVAFYDYDWSLNSR